MGVGKEGMRRGSGSKGMGGRWRERNEGEVEGKERVGGEICDECGKGWKEEEGKE